MWEASNGHLLSAPSGIFRGTRAPMSWSPDGKRFAAVSEEGVRVWDTNSWHPLITLPPEDTGYGFVLVWSPDSIRLFIGGGNRDGAIWDAASGQKITTLVNSAHSKGLSWSTDGKRLVGASYWGPLIWDAATGQQIVIHGSVSNPVWSPDGTRFAAFDNKGKSVTIWGEE